MLIYNSRNSFGLLAATSVTNEFNVIYNSRNSFGLLAYVGTALKQGKSTIVEIHLAY